MRCVFLPRLHTHEAADDGCEFLRELFDRAIQDARGFRISVSEQLVQLVLADLIAGRVTERIFTDLAHTLAPVVENGSKRAIAGAVTDEAVGRPQLGVIGIDDDRTQLRGAMTRNDRRIG